MPGPRRATAGCLRALPRPRHRARQVTRARRTRRPDRAPLPAHRPPSRRRPPPRSTRSDSSSRAAGAGPEKRSPSSVSTTSTRCSSVLGPASVPSLVTWPTRITGVAESLANAWSRAAVARTWPTEPCGPSSSSAMSVWIESTMSRRRVAGLGRGHDRVDVRLGQHVDLRTRRAARRRPGARRGAGSGPRTPPRTRTGPARDQAARRWPPRPPARASTCRCPVRHPAGRRCPERGRRPGRDRPRRCPRQRGRRRARRPLPSAVSAGAATGARVRVPDARRGRRRATLTTRVSTSVFQPPHERHWPSQRRLDAPHVPHT